MHELYQAKTITLNPIYLCDTITNCIQSLDGEMRKKKMKFNKYNSLIIKAFFSVLVYVNIIAEGKDKIIFLILLYSLSICNDFYRKKVLRNNNSGVTWEIRAVVSILFSIGTACILKYIAGTYIYIYIILIELLFYNRKQIPANLLGLYGVCYLLTDLGRFLKEGSIEVFIYILVITAKWGLKFIGASGSDIFGGGLMSFACGSLIGRCSYISYRYLFSGSL